MTPRSDKVVDGRHPCRCGPSAFCDAIMILIQRTPRSRDCASLSPSAHPPPMRAPDLSLALRSQPIQSRPVHSERAGNLVQCQRGHFAFRVERHHDLSRRRLPATTLRRPPVALPLHARSHISFRPTSKRCMRWSRRRARSQHLQRRHRRPAARSTPRPLARSRPSPVPPLMRVRSNSARPPRIVNINTP
jgi:hypothetical protein